jgi:hypothetical protein
MVEENLKPRKGRRVTIDLTPSAAEEIDRLAKDLGVSTPDVFRQSFSLFRLYVNARKEGKKLVILDDAKTPKEMVQLELALPNL